MTFLHTSTAPRPLSIGGRAGVVAAAMAMMLAACGSDPGEISRDSQPFDAIAPQATISLLGNEPFWGVEIAPENDGYRAVYSTPDNNPGTGFAVTRFAGNNGVGFTGEFDGEAVQIAVTPGACSDTMSDRIYPYTATVAVGEVTLLGCGYTSDEPFTQTQMP